MMQPPHKTVQRLLLISCFLICEIITSYGQTNLETIEWSELPSIPDSIGFNGSFIGVHHEVLIVAGGANFPNSPAWAGGDKRYYDNVYILRKEAEGFKWFTRKDLKLPRPLAYGVSIETIDGIIAVGGSNAQGTYSEVFIMKWDKAQQTLKIEDLPELPVPLSAMGGDIIDNTIYVAGGQESVNGPATKHFFELDLNLKGTDDFQWKALDPWPGPARINPVVVAQNDGRVNALYVFSGRDFQPSEQLPHRLHSDVYAFNPKSGVWSQKNNIPTNGTPGIADGFIGAAPVVAHGGSHILIFGGAGGPNQHLMERQELALEISKLKHSADDPFTEAKAREMESHAMDLFRRTSFSPIVWAYHTITDTWVRAGTLHQPSQVVTSAVTFNNQIVIPGGELAPGVRTTRVSQGVFKPYAVDFGLVNYITLGTYLALIVGMGWFFSKRNKSSEDYFLAGKRVPWWAAGLSIYATMLSAITYLSQPALAYSFDWQAYFGYLTILMMAPVVIYYYLPYYRRLNITTAYEYLEQRFNLATRIFGSLSFVLFQLARMGIVVYLPALALSTVIGMNIYLAIVLMGLLAIVYTVLGGIEAVIWTDVLQVAVLLGGLLIGLFYILMDIGDFNYLLSTALNDNKLQLMDLRWSTTEVVTWSLFLGSFALNIAPYTTDQAVVQRYLTTPSEKEAAKSIWLSGLLSIPAGFLIFCMGTFLYVYFKQHPDLLTIGMENDQIFPLFIANQLPAGIGGLVIAGIFSASMSSLDSSMHSVSTVITVDFYRRFTKNVTENTSLLIARCVTLIVGVLGTLVACIMAVYPVASIFFLFQEILGLFGSAVAAVFILGVFTKRANGPGVLAGALVSLVAVVWVKYMTPLNFYIYPLVGIPAGVLSGYLISKLTKPKDTAGYSE